MRTVLLFGSGILLGTIVACAGGEPDLPAFVARDSAGIEVVENERASLGAEDSWRVDPEPVLELGTVEGDEPFVFTRIWDAARFEDGRIAVVDEISMELRLFDAEGTHLGTFGGGGDGPEEFAGPPFIEVSGPDELMAWDGGHLRMSRFGTDGVLRDQVNMQPPLGDAGIAAFRNGRVWAIDADGALMTFRPERPSRGDGHRDSFRRITLFRDGGSRMHDFGTFLTGHSFVVRLERMSIGVGNPWAPHHAAGLLPGPRVAIGDGTGWEVRIFDAEGGLQRIVRAAIPRVAVGDSLLASARERPRQLAETSPLTVAQAEEAFSQLDLPDSVPAIASIRGSGEELWVGRRTGSWWETGDFDVFDADGRWLTTVAMPPELEMVHEIGDDYILAHVTDDLDVAYLRMYRLRRGG